MGGQIVDATIVAAPKQRNLGYSRSLRHRLHRISQKAGKHPGAYEQP
jgi:hypothetical protein